MGPSHPAIPLPQQLPPTDSICKGFKGRPFPGQVVQIPGTVRARCVNSIWMCSCVVVVYAVIVPVCSVVPAAAFMRVCRSVTYGILMLLSLCQTSTYEVVCDQPLPCSTAASCVASERRAVPCVWRFCRSPQDFVVVRFPDLHVLRWSSS